MTELIFADRDDLSAWMATCLRHQVWVSRKVDDSEHIVTAKPMKADGHASRDIAKYLGVS